jgi:hypothetical protein
MRTPDGLASVEVLSTAYVPFQWNTPWGAPNATDADHLWENINTAHGHIAVAHTWAAENNVCLLNYHYSSSLLTKRDVDSGLAQWISQGSPVKECTCYKPTTNYTVW